MLRCYCYSHTTKRPNETPNFRFICRERKHMHTRSHAILPSFSGILVQFIFSLMFFSQLFRWCFLHPVPCGQCSCWLYAASVCKIAHCQRASAHAVGRTERLSNHWNYVYYGVWHDIIDIRRFNVISISYAHRAHTHTHTPISCVHKQMKWKNHSKWTVWKFSANTLRRI